MNKTRFNEKIKEEKAITLIALVITIVVLIILAGIFINLTIGESGIITRAKKAREDFLTAANEEQRKLDELEAKFNERFLGDVYTDDMIGQKLTYSANGEDDWIVFGRDQEGNILITTEKPVHELFNIQPTMEQWVTYESDLNTACSGYGGTIQGIQVSSRSITMDDIDYVTGVQNVELTRDGKTFNTREFDSYKFGTGNGELNIMYPVLTGGTSGNGTGTGCWKTPTRANEKPFTQNTYGYFYEDSGVMEGQTYQYMYSNMQDSSSHTLCIAGEDVGLINDNFKYIVGGNTEETWFDSYLIASKTIVVYGGNSPSVEYRIAATSGTFVGTYTKILGSSDADGGYDADYYFNYGEDPEFYIRPVVELPPELRVKMLQSGEYDIVS